MLKRVCVVVVAAVAALGAMVGCGKSGPAMPATVPVQGRLNFTKGGTVKALADREAAIEFQSVEQPDVFAFGSIQEDGTFTVTTVKDGVGVAGAIPGKHRVRLNLDTAAKALVAPQFLSFDQSKLTVTVPSPGEIVVQVWR